MEFGQRFQQMSGTCSHSGKGTVAGLTDTSFQLVGYETVSTNCNLAMFSKKNYSVTFELNSSQTKVFLHPAGYECYSLTKK